MGYYTKYFLEIDNDNKVPNCDHNSNALKFCPECGVRYGTVPLLEKLKKEILAEFEDAGFAGQHDEVKWYEHEKDMRAFSLKYPDILFTLRGEGEESGDIWRKYFKAGKVQVVRETLVFDEYDEKKLQ